MRPMIPLHVPLLELKEIFAFPGEDFVSRVKSSLQTNLGKRNIAFTADGRNAIQLALQVMQLQREDEILVPGYICPSVRAAIEPVCRPVYVDINPATFNMDLREIEGRVTKNTRAMLIAHLYGNPCPMREIMEIAKAYQLQVIENVAQALGGRYNNKVLGSFGDFTVFSFRFTKDITCFRGGMLASHHELSNDSRAPLRLETNLQLLIAISALKQIKFTPSALYWPLREKILFPFFVKNAALFHKKVAALSNYQCYLLYQQLGRLQEVIEKRRENARYYGEKLQGIVELPQQTENGEHTYYRYVIKTDRRDALYRYFLTHGIEADKTPDYCLAPARCPQSLQASRNSLAMPVHQQLGQEELEKIVGAIREFSKVE